MIFVEQHTTDMAFEQKLVKEVCIVRRSPKEWYFTFLVADPTNAGQTLTYAVKTQRGALRTWSDPRTLFAYLDDRYGVVSGTFTLSEETHEHSGSP